jgi:Asp-tRNA(Asn)/Glu-tRNA(Gln) amidotransferase A subunit family amidase
VVNILATSGITPDSGGFGNQFFVDRAGIYGKTVKDAVLVLDAIKDPDRGYFDPRNIYTSLPKSFVPDEPYTSFLVGEEDVDKNPLAGMRIGIVREFMAQSTTNDVAISEKLDNEIKTILRDKLGAELVESVDPQFPDDPGIPNMVYTFEDAFSEILPRLAPQIFSRTDSSGDLRFAVPGFDVTSYDYLLKLSTGEAPLSDAIKIDTIRGASGFPNALTFKFEIERYLIDRGDEKITDWESWVDNARWRQDSSRAGAENWVATDNTISSGKPDQMAMSYIARLAVLKVMDENDIDVFVNPENTVPTPKIQGPNVGSISCCGALTALLQLPQIVVPAGFNQINVEPEYALNTDKDNYISISGTEESLLPNPMPISMMFWAGPGDDPTLFKVASAYEAATQHRTPPPDFGPLPGEP